jgi:hypothetical protein
VGFLRNMKAKSQYSAAMSAYEAELAAWKLEHEQTDTLLYAATHLEELFQEADKVEGVRLMRGENLLLAIAGGGLVEPRVSRGSYQGGSQGVSFRVAKGVRYRVGQHRGTYQSGPEEQKVIDTGGTAYLTTHRVLYASPARSREWAYARTVDVYHTDGFPPGWGVTYLAVSNRDKTSGFSYTLEVAEAVRGRLQLALAIHDETLEDMVSGLREEQRELRNRRPVEPQRPQELDT